MNKESIKQAAEKLFATTTHQVLWGNAKGEFFTSENAGKISLKNDEVLIKCERASNEDTDDNAVKPINHFEAIATIKAATTLEALQPFEADTRKSVKTAYDEKHAELLALVNVNPEQ